MGRRRWGAFAAVLAVVAMVPAAAWALGPDWRDHRAPFDFRFDNHIDTHQQSQVAGKDGLVGFLYITPSGETTRESEPIVMHGDCTAGPDDCTVGWLMKGRAASAEYCGHLPGEHPAWAIDPEDMPRTRGFTHFHWLDESDHEDGLTPGKSYDGYVLKLTAIDTFVFDHHGEYLVTPGIDFETHANIFASCEEWEASMVEAGHSR